MLVLISFCSPTDFIAAKMTKENAAACTNKQKQLETEKQTTHNTADEDSEQAIISPSSQSTSSEEESKPQTSKEEGKLSQEQQETNEEEKRGDEKMEVDPCPETAVSNPEEGTCSKLNDLSFNFGLSMMLFVNGCLFPPSTELRGSFLQIKTKTKALPRLLCSL